MHKKLKALLLIPRRITNGVVRLTYEQFLDLIDTSSGPDWSLSISPMQGCIATEAKDNNLTQFSMAVNPCTKVKLTALEYLDTRLLAEFAFRCREHRVFLDLASDPNVFEHVMQLEPIHADFAAGIRDMQELLRVATTKDAALNVLRELGL